MANKVSTALVELPTKPHALYRFFDRTDVLLYVGITMDLGLRMKRHKLDKPWWAEVANITVEHFPTRKAALAAEKEAIRAEAPLYNDVHNALVAHEFGLPIDDIDYRWLAENWPKVPRSVRDHVEIPASNQGRLELAEDIFEWFSETEVEQFQTKALRDALEDGDEFNEPDPSDGAYLMGRAAVVAVSTLVDQVARLTALGNHIMQALPDTIRERVVAEARGEVVDNMAANYEPFDVAMWAYYRALEELASPRQAVGG